ncbi:hypothetical protein FMEXI_11428 [Fusarium mexicanum]|uniref:Uncharacterized protein n=1 Tax=Fusarium mexicanum TaxID=751941 RepID=A0A8H5IBW5_9HYPO|nr:hypothetical protein FMEXI_11428 [Fusarium mexicanum]
MSADQYSQQRSDSIMGGVNTGAVYPGDCRDQPATANESRDEADVSEMLSLTAQLADLSVTSANPTGRISKPPNAHEKICRKRTIHDPYPVLEHYLHGLRSVSTALCPRHAAGAEAIRRYHRSVLENRRHMSAAIGLFISI